METKETKRGKESTKRGKFIGVFACFCAFLPFLLPPRNVSFSKDVAPILFKSCANCHKPDDIAPFSVLSYKDVRPWAKSIREKVINREMPPWSADPRYGDFSNNPSLSQNEIDTIVAWVDQGAKEGDPKDLPPAPQFNETWEIGKPDVILAMPEEHTLAAAGADDYIYFRVPTNFTEDKWIQAVEFRPGNKRVVHHAAVFIESPDMLEMARANASRRGQSFDPRSIPSLFESESGSVLRKEGTVRRVSPDAQVIDDGCSSPNGGAIGGSAGARLLCVYAPGRNADIWPAGTAKRVPAGSNFIFQMHYAKTTGKPEKDRTILGVQFAKAPVEKMIESRDVTNFFFKIPPGAENHEATACYTFPRDVQLINYMPHMHVRGKDMKYELVYPDGRRETLLSVDYNFNWQTLYKLKRPVPVPRGTKLMVTAHFDNSAKNSRNPDPTRVVRFGEPTYDEMLVGFIDFIREMPKERIIAQVDPNIYDAYTGEYAVAPGPKFTILREGDKLFFVAPGQPRIQAFPESETKFFFKIVDAQVTFIKNDKGEVTELLFEMNRRNIRAKKVDKDRSEKQN
jgi:Domain of unknown function (DUF3471)/Copper type II ascorbate-dependent monooxygenase, C-terminal domain